jgi:hypothetical protein
MSILAAAAEIVALSRRKDKFGSLDLGFGKEHCIAYGILTSVLTFVRWLLISGLWGGKERENAKHQEKQALAEDLT